MCALKLIVVVRVECNEGKERYHRTQSNHFENAQFPYDMDYIFMWHEIITINNKAMRSLDFEQVSSYLLYTCHLATTALNSSVFVWLPKCSNRFRSNTYLINFNYITWFILWFTAACCRCEFLNESAQLFGSSMCGIWEHTVANTIYERLGNGVEVVIHFFGAIIARMWHRTAFFVWTFL